MAFSEVGNKLVKTSAFLLIIAAACFAFLNFSNSRLYSVQSGSMSPAISKGDLLVVSETPETELVHGDIVTYINPANRQQTITHRIIETPSAENEYKFITKGDANQIFDKPLASEYIIGKQVCAVPYAGYALDVARHPAGLILLVYIPALLVLSGEVRRLSDYYRSFRPYYASEAVRRQIQGREQLEDDKARGSIRTFAVASIFALSFVTAQAYAAPTPTATVLNNRITTASRHDDNKKPGSNHSAEIKCSNDIKINNSTEQASRSGDAVVERNNTGGNSTTGNSSNTNNANINLKTNCR